VQPWNKEGESVMSEEDGGGEEVGGVEREGFTVNDDGEALVSVAAAPPPVPDPKGKGPMDPFQ